MTDPRDGGRISTGDILSGTADLLRRGALRAGAVMAILTAAGVMLDSGMAADSYAVTLNLLVSTAVLAMQYWLTRAILQDLRRGAFAAPRFGAFFVLGVITTVGILVGLVLLIVPGVVLMVRWSIAVPILLGSDDSVFAALRRSWRETGPHFWPILLAFLAIYAPMILLVITGGWLEIILPGSLFGILLFNLALNGGLIAGWHAAVAIPVALGDSAGLTEVFE